MVNPAGHFSRGEGRLGQPVGCGAGRGGRAVVDFGEFSSPRVRPAWQPLRTAPKRCHGLGVRHTSMAWRWFRLTDRKIALVWSAKSRMKCTDPPEPLTRVREVERDTLHFALIEASLQPEDRTKLDRWGAMLRRNRFCGWRCMATPMPSGPEGYNAAFPERRAQAALPTSWTRAWRQTGCARTATAALCRRIQRQCRLAGPATEGWNSGLVEQAFIEVE